VPLGLGSGIAALLGVAVAATLPAGSPLRFDHVDGGSLGALFLGAAAAAFALYVIALVVLRRGSMRIGLVCTIAVVIQLLPLAGPLILSRDVYAYWAYGRVISVHDANPYTVPPVHYPTDPAQRAMSPVWRPDTTVYGPVFSWSSALLAKITGPAPELSALAYRIVAAVGMLVAVLLAALIASRAAFATAFIGWNPLLALTSAGGGHNDIWMAVLMLGALLLAQQGRHRLAGACWIVAGGLKWIALAFVPLQLAAAARVARKRTIVGLLVAGSGLAAAASMAFGTSWLAALQPFAHRRSAYAVQSRLTQLGLGHTAARAVVLGLLGLTVVFLVRNARAGRPRLGLGAAAILLATPWILPWYTAWAVALAAVEEDLTTWILVLALSGYLLPDRVPI